MSTLFQDTILGVGGLALFWKNMINLHVQDSSPLYIDAVVNLGVDDASGLQVSMEIL